MWPPEEACRNIRQRVREVVRSFPSNGQVGVVKSSSAWAIAPVAFGKINS